MVLSLRLSLLHRPRHRHISVFVLTAIFPGEPGLAGTRMSPFWIALQLRLMEVVSGDK